MRGVRGEALKDPRGLALGAPDLIIYPSRMLGRTLLLLLVSILPALGQVKNPELKDTPLASLSDRTFSALATKALAIRPTEWKHSETEHFIYHYFQSFIATPVSVEAEFFYNIVAKELERDTKQWERKCHVFIFESDAEWDAFRISGKLDPWSGGLCTGGELFIMRDPKRKWKGDTLGHEVTHLVVYRFMGNGVPLWLNEGYAEYTASRGYSSFWRLRGYKAAPRSRAVNPAAWIPLTRLTSLVEYPSDELEVITFYSESERLVRFLASVDKKGFLAFFESMAQGNRIESALSKGFSSRFFNLDALDREAKIYATKDFGTTVQDQAEK